MATQATSSSLYSTSSSSPSSSCPRWKYDVFLSFCGVDTRKNFTDHLYTALKQKGIITFRDDEKLERGKYISSELLKAIEESKYAIIVLSTNYASSRWCLIELAKIVKCMKETGLTVLPVFYHVDPSDVKNQSGTLAKAFAKHEEDIRINTEDVQAWKAALKDVGHISGWHLHDRHESIVIQEILKRIFSENNLIFQRTIFKDLVGIESRVKEMLDLYLNEGMGGVRFVGICGMGGMGKTTIAQEIFKRISCNFDATCFIANVREATKNQHLVSLQKQLLSKILESEINIWNVNEGIGVIGNILCNKKVLIVLDDVDRDKQIEALVGKHDWFGLGSRIIITSRDRQLLGRHGVDDVYTAKGLNDDEALELFSRRAFKNPHPEENYANLSWDFVRYANGLPLALNVLGSSLFGRRIDAWRGARDKLKSKPDREILNILQISFDGLEDTEKELFLDIACFFKGEIKDCIRDVLESFGYYPDYDIDVLIAKSLITIDEDGILGMHDLLQKLGQEIVRRESHKEPGGRSRLWIYEDVLHVLKKNTGTEVVEGIVLNISIPKEEHLNYEVFSKMKKLRLLKINFAQPQHGLIRGNVQLPKSFSYLSDELCIIEWHGYPFKSMPTSFQANKLVELRMHCSRIIKLWKGIMNLDQLKLIDLSDSQNLTKIPNLNGAQKLKQLILRHCTRLYKIHASLGDLKQLIRLDLNGCKSLVSLPHKISLEALETFDLGGCLRLKKFPEIVGNMSRLSELCLSGTAIKDLLGSMKLLSGLIKLDLGDCKNLSTLPNVCCCLMSLKILILSGCSKINELPENLGNIKGLEELDVSETAVKKLPSSLALLKNLKSLSLRGCKGLSSISSNKHFSFPLMRKRGLEDPTGMLGGSLSVLWSLSSLEDLDLRGNNIVFHPESITRLSNMKTLSLNSCIQLEKFPSNIRNIYANGCTPLEIPLEILPLRHKDGPYSFLYHLNCVKLINNEDYGDMLLTTLRHRIIKFKGDGVSDITIPGIEIPKWFRHQSVGTSVNLQVPSDKLKGVAVCAVFVLHEHHPLHQIHSNYNRITHWLQCYLKANGSQIKLIARFPFSEEFGKIELYHLYLIYYPYKLSDQELKKIWSQIDSDGLGQIEIGFQTEGPGLEVTKCGARWVYEQDIEDLNQTKRGCSSSSNNCSITPYKDDLEDLAKDTKTKQSRDDCGDKARTSRESTSKENMAL